MVCARVAASCGCRASSRSCLACCATPPASCGANSTDERLDVDGCAGPGSSCRASSAGPACGESRATHGVTSTTPKRGRWNSTPTRSSGDRPRSTWRSCTAHQRRDSSRDYVRNGYRVIQRGGRYGRLFASVALRQLRAPASERHRDDRDLERGAMIGPVWAPRRRLVWMHHVHRDMWAEVLPRPLDALGRCSSRPTSPLFYRRSRFATLSESSADEIEDLGIDRRRLTVIPPGVHERFTPDSTRRADHPHVVVVGRLAPVKRQRLALAALAEARRRVPSLTVELVGDGPDRSLVDTWVADHDARELGGSPGPRQRRRSGRCLPSSVVGGEAAHAEGSGDVADRGWGVRDTVRRHRRRGTSRLLYRRPHWREECRSTVDKMSDIALNIRRNFSWVQLVMYCHELIVPGLVQFVTIGNP